MKVRYTEPAADDLENIISYFRDVAPSIVGDFADCIDNAIAKLVDNPYLVQETEKSGVRRWYIRRFRFVSSSLLMVTNWSSSTSNTQHAGRPGVTKR